MNEIFISYRRGETGGYAGRLHDRLVAEFGDGSVFMDLSAIDPGVDFEERIEEAVGGAEAVLVMIGRDWLDATDGAGRRRLEDPGDFVHREVLGAIERDALVVPVLVHGAEMPSPERLPEPLRSLGRRNAMVLSDAGWARDVDRLIVTLRERIPRRAHRRAGWRRPRLVLAAGALLAIAGIAAVALTRAPGGAQPARPATLRVVEETAVGGYPVSAAVTGDKVWVAQQGENRLKVIDAETGDPDPDTPDLGRDLSVLAVTAGRLWVGDYGRRPTDGVGSLVDIDPDDGRPLGKPIRIGDPVALAADRESLWVVDLLGEVQRVDIGTRAVTGSTRVDGATDVALLGGTAWVASFDGNEVVPFDARTAKPRGRPIEITKPSSVAAGHGAVWVATVQGQLFRVPRNGGRPRSVGVGGEGPRWVEVDAKGVWLADLNGNVALVDPERLTVSARTRLADSEPQGLALDAGGAWVLRSRSTAESTVARIVLQPGT